MLQMYVQDAHQRLATNVKVPCMDMLTHMVICAEIQVGSFFLVRPQNWQTFSMTWKNQFVYIKQQINNLTSELQLLNMGSSTPCSDVLPSQGQGNFHPPLSSFRPTSSAPRSTWSPGFGLGRPAAPLLVSSVASFQPPSIAALASFSHPTPPGQQNSQRQSKHDTLKLWFSCSGSFYSKFQEPRLTSLHLSNQLSPRWAFLEFLQLLHFANILSLLHKLTACLQQCHFSLLPWLENLVSLLVILLSLHL